MSKNTNIFSFLAYPEAFLEYQTPPLTITKIITLKNFVKHLKHRLSLSLSTIYDDFDENHSCAKLVTRRRNGFGPLETHRCGGYVDEFGCYKCDPEFECVGECGYLVMKAGSFCSTGCKAEYFKDFRGKRSRSSRYY
jgi:hypothetical protein